MGLLGEEDDDRMVEEVKISAGEEADDDERIERSSGSDVSLDDIHSQNERIISLLEKMVVEDEIEEDQGQQGDFDGVL